MESTGVDGLPSQQSTDVVRRSSRVPVGREDKIPGVFEERLHQLKQSRSAAKGCLTRKIDEIELLLQNSDYSNLSEVRDKISYVYEAMKNFKASHDAYHVNLLAEHDILVSNEYYREQEQRVISINRQFEDWLADAELRARATLLEIAPEDSVSNVGSRRKSKGSSVLSGSSSNSKRSVSSGRLKAAARKAVLEAKAASLKGFQELQKEEFILKQRKEELTIKAEIAEAEAEERVFLEAEALQNEDEKLVLDSRVVESTPLAQQDHLMSVSRFLGQGFEDYAPHCSKNNSKIGVSNKLNPVGGSKQTYTVNPRGAQAPAVSKTSYSGLPEEKPEKSSSIKVEGGCENFSESRSNVAIGRTSQYLVDLQRQQQLQNERLMLMQQQQNSQVQMLLAQQQQYTMALTLPQPKVPVFRGDPSEYCTFIRAFESLIEAKTPSDSARLYYLVQYTESEVQELMKSCLLMKADEGYKEARRLLKVKYGQRHKIAAAYLHKVVDGPAIKSGDGASLHRFAVTLTSCKNTLKDIGLINKIENPDIMQKIVGRLPLGLKLKWRDVADKISEEIKREITINDLAEFVEKKARAATHPIFGDVESKSSNASKARLGTKPQRVSTFVSQANEATSNGEDLTNKSDENISSASLSKRPACPLCNNLHWLSQCDKFKEMSVEERRSFVRKNSLCDNCLISGHIARSCEKRSFCKVSGCKVKHSTFLHPTNRIPVSTSETAAEAQNSFVNVGASNSTGAGNSVPVKSKVGMAIVPVKVRGDGQDQLIETYAFLDSGSNTTFCTESLLSQLGLEGVNTTLSLTTMEKTSSLRECKALSLEVYDLNENESVVLPVVFSMSSLPVTSKDIPLQEDVDKWKHLDGVHLSSIIAQIGLLIGCDVPKALEPREFRSSKDGGPYATKTMFGWVINGPLGRSKKPITRTANFVRADAQLSKQFEQFCNMEFNDSVFDDSTSMSREDIHALEVFEKSIDLIDGHYNVAIPWKISPPNLPNNKSVAISRLKYLNKKLSGNPEIKQKYSAFMDDLLEKGYARKVPEDQIDRNDGKVWYLPHHSVVHPQKPDKTRVVFDCAAKFRGTSLNDCVLQGPDLTNSLVGVLTRFRNEPIAFMADIESMFFQVKVPSNDIDALRFLWYPNNDLDKEPREYQMLVHLFGGVWSPSCANFALLRTSQDKGHLFDGEVAEVVRKNFYVDDCLKSVKSEKRAVQLIDQLRRLLLTGGFKLTKWTSNSRAVLESIPTSERAKEVKDLDLHKDCLPVERALGVRWNTETDQFMFKIVIKGKPPTRRGLLSVVSSIYDPLGFVSPFVLTAKFILQELCRGKLSWDDPIPDDMLVRWDRWINELPSLERFTVDRCFTPPQFGAVITRELHHFSDASCVGYGAVSYLRSINENGQAHCSLIQAKSRLAPMKQVTIPRLELAAAVVSARLDRMIRKEMDLDIVSSTFWTDSTCVLRYVNNKHRRFQTYVANRVSSILEVSKPSQWKYVDTKSNPADDVLRGLSAESLVENRRWKYGPQFLMQTVSKWPSQPNDIGRISEDDSELKKDVRSFATSTTESNIVISNIFKRFSSWNVLKKFVAWILRFRAGLRVLVLQKREKECKKPRQKKVEPISVEELNEAEVAILKYVQGVAFEEELSAITVSRNKKSSTLNGLDPILVNGLICVGGRLKHAPIQDDARHPVILPKKHHIVDLIVRHYHSLVGHSGVEYVLSVIRSKFWIVRARVAVKKILKACFVCRKLQAPVGQQKMADLPEDRVTPNKPPFSFVGVDCFGPFKVRRGRSEVKRYGVLFTCFTIRAVHLEVAHSMDTNSFINALRRFISRRGVPQRIRSDNGSNFVGGERELKEEIDNWNQNKIHEYLLQQNIEWIFNPPAGSHHGGVWERCIRTVRKIIRAVVKEQTLDDEGLSTLFCEVESIVNGRPITKVSEDPRDMEALTPNHLLLLRSGALLPPGLFCREDTYSRKRWRQVQYLADVFWRRWIREYLPALQKRQKWVAPVRNFMVDDVVLIVDDTVPRGSWPLGRIIEVHRSSHDGYVRSVTVTTNTSTLHRPVDKIVLLEEADFAAY